MSQARNVTPISGPVIPDKLYFRIGEVARLLHVETHTLRFWESEFPHLKVGKGGTGQRLYRRKDVERLLDIKHLLYELGYTIPGARQILASRTRRADSIESSKQGSNSRKPEDNMERIRAELRELSALLGKAPHARPAKADVSVLRRHGRGAEKNTGLSSKDGKRALHLASRSNHPAGMLPIQHGPGLFDTKPENS